MKFPTMPLIALAAVAALAAAPTAAVRAQTNYQPGPDSKPQEGVPKGEVIKLTFENSKIFPGTFRDYWIYVPAQYSPDKPACVYVNQDGVQWSAPTVFDNLIARKEIPVTIGVFVMHGRVRAKDGQAALDRFNRSLEYDGLGDAYARFLLDELLPEVERQKTSDGRPIRLSHSGNDRAIGGSSSGAIAAFTAAWERPDAFSRVFSTIGTYVGLRGGNEYPTLIRKTEPKPLRVFLQDGSNDLNIYGGDWWMANQMMERALTFAGYEVNHEWGDGGHSGQQGNALFPDAIRWLWKGWPEPVKAGTSRNGMLTAMAIPGETWATARVDLPAADRVVAHNGNAYVLEPAKKDSDPGRVWLVPAKGKRVAVDTGIRAPGGVTLSPDQTLLYVNDSKSHWVYSYQIQPDGTLKHKQQYYWLHVPDTADDSGAGGMKVDREGKLYVATRMGIQVCDQAGRVNVILPLPNNGPVTRLGFAGPNRDLLVAQTADGRIFQRRIKAVGVESADAPLRPAPPGL